MMSAIRFGTQLPLLARVREVKTQLVQSAQAENDAFASQLKAEAPKTAEAMKAKVYINSPQWGQLTGQDVLDMLKERIADDEVRKQKSEQERAEQYPLLWFVGRTINPVSWLIDALDSAPATHIASWAMTGEFKGNKEQLAIEQALADAADLGLVEKFEEKSYSYTIKFYGFPVPEKQRRLSKGFW